MHDRAKLEARALALRQRLAELASRVSELEKLRGSVDQDERKFIGTSRIEKAVYEAAGLAGQRRDERNRPT
jgi:hypothetical protein